MLKQKPSFIKLFAIAFGCALALFAFLLFVVFRSIFANAYIAKGDKHMAKAEYQSAIVDFKSAKNWTPKKQKVYLKLAEAYCANEEFDSASQTIQTAIDKHVTTKDSGLEELYIMNIQVLSASGSLEDAVKFIDEFEDQYILKKIQQVRPADLSYSPRQGSYDKTLKMTIEVPEGQTVYYTTDGTFPTKFSTSYTAPINVGIGTTQINAVAVDEKGLVSPLLNVSYTVTNENQTVEFDDKKVELMVRAALSKPSGSIRVKELESITLLSNLGIEGSIKTLSDLELMPNLEEIYLEGEKSMLSIAQLSGKTKLRSLSLIGCDLDSSEITPLGSLTALETLDLSDNNLTSVSVIANMTALKYIYLDNNWIKDISVIENLKELEVLNAIRNNINTLPEFTNEHKILALELSDNMISDVSSIHMLSKLEHLNLANNNISSCKNLVGLTNLITLVLDSNNINNFDFLSSMQKLSVLNVSNTGFVNTKTISKLNLSSFHAANTGISTLKDLANSTSLSMLEIQNTNVSSLEPIQYHEHLDYLDISGCKISSVAPLSTMKALYTLRAVGVDLSNVSFINDVLVLQ